MTKAGAGRDDLTHWLWIKPPAAGLLFPPIDDASFSSCIFAVGCE